MVGRQKDVQKLVNQEARLTTGAFRTTNQGALSLESGFRPAVAQLENRVRRFALPPKGRPGQGTRRGLGQRPWTETAVRPRMLERQRGHGPPRGGLPPGRVHHDRGRGRSGVGSEATRPARRNLCRMPPGASPYGSCAFPGDALLPGDGVASSTVFQARAGEHRSSSPAIEPRSVSCPHNKNFTAYFIRYLYIRFFIGPHSHAIPRLIPSNV